jgi:hypothetical protein
MCQEISDPVLKDTINTEFSLHDAVEAELI